MSERVYFFVSKKMLTAKSFTHNMLKFSTQECAETKADSIMTSTTSPVISDTVHTQCYSTLKKKLNEIYGTKYCISLNHQIVFDHGVFYPQALYNDLVFELTLAPASQVVKGSDPSKLKYKLTNIQPEYGMIRNHTLADKTRSVYSSGKEFAYDHMTCAKVVPLKNKCHEDQLQSRRLKSNSQRVCL